MWRVFSFPSKFKHMQIQFSPKIVHGFYIKIRGKSARIENEKAYSVVACNVLKIGYLVFMKRTDP